MNFFPTFSAWPFALAGLCCAMGPVIIHWLHRRRFRVVAWPAMDFLRQAMNQDRQRRQWRDLVLMVLRCLAVLMIGISLAQPFVHPRAPWTWSLAMIGLPLFVMALTVAAVLWANRLVRWVSIVLAVVVIVVLLSVGWSERRSLADARSVRTGPVHVIVVIDNSLSMAYRSLDGTSLERAKRQAKKLVRRLPDGSRMTVLPMLAAGRGGGSISSNRAGPAIDQISRVALVDASARLDPLRAAIKRAGQSTGLPEVVVVFTDLQSSNFSTAGDADPDWQFVDVGPESWSNVSVSGLALPDGLAGALAPSSIVVELEYHGDETNRLVPVTLSVDGTVVATRSAAFSGSGKTQVLFQHQFAELADAKRQDVALTASIPDDRLPDDNQRHLVVPFASDLEIIFVDQLGSESEDPLRMQIGETYPLRRLVRAAETRDVFNVRHLRPTELTQATLENARLVVMAGVAGPEGKVPLLRQFVEQGGQLLIAAGGEFDTVRWQQDGWRDGDGVLPLPLRREMRGHMPGEKTGGESAFGLSYDSLATDSWLRVDGLNERGLRDLYAEAVFFQAVRVDDDSAGIAELRKRALEKLESSARLRREFMSLRAAKGGALSGAERKRLDELQASLRRENPAWLIWPARAELSEWQGSEEQLRRQWDAWTDQRMPRVLARYEGGDPCFVERRMGRGRVVFFASGLRGQWNLLSRLNVALVYDRLMRSMILSTLRQANYRCLESIELPLDGKLRGKTVNLVGGALRSEQEVGFLGNSRVGVQTRIERRGVYRLTASSSGREERPQTNTLIAFSVNGPAAESEFRRLPLGTERASGMRVVNAERISLVSGASTGEHIWWFVLLIVFVMLGIEMGVAAGTAT